MKTVDICQIAFFKRLVIRKGVISILTEFKLYGVVNKDFMKINIGGTADMIG